MRSLLACDAVRAVPRPPGHHGSSRAGAGRCRRRCMPRRWSCTRDWRSRAAELEHELQRLHYRRADRLDQPGTYHLQRERSSTSRCGRRASRMRARPAQPAQHRRRTPRGIESLRDSAGHDVPMLRLEPLLIGSIFPIHGEDRIVVTPQEVPPLLPAALKAVEDRKFDTHHGVDPIAMLRAVWVNLRARPDRAGRQHAHPAAGAQLLPRARARRCRASCARPSWRWRWMRTSPRPIS